MKQKLRVSTFGFLILFLLGSHYLNAQNLSLDWVAQISGSGGSIVTSSSAVDDLGNVFAVGAFEDSIELTTINNGPVKLRSKGAFDMFIVKINPVGAIVWIKSIGGKGTLGPSENRDFALNTWFNIKLDQDQNLYITGNFKDTVDFDPGVGQAIKTTKSYIGGVFGGGTPPIIFQEHSFILKLNKEGEFVWVRTLFGAKNSSAGISLDHKEGSLCITGYFSDTLSLDDGQSVNTFMTPSKGFRNVFVIKYDTSGRFVWAKQMGNKGAQNEGLDIHVDKKGFIYTTGVFHDSADFDPGIGTAYLLSTAKPGMNVFVSKLNSKGDYVWAKAIGSVTTGAGARSSSITADKDGNVYTTGYFQVLGNFDPKSEPQHMMPATPNLSYFLSKLDSNGIYVWANTLNRPGGKNGVDNGSGVQVNEKGDVFTTGYFSGEIYFDSDPTNLSREVFKSGGSSRDAFILKVKADGSFDWAKVLKSDPNSVKNSTNVGMDIFRSNSNNIYVSGYFSGKADFNSPGTARNLTSLNPEATDGFVLKLFCGDTTSSKLSIALCANEFELLGNTFKKDGDYVVRTIGSSGCDSTIFLNLILNDIIKPDITVNGFELGTVETYATYQWLFDDQIISGATSNKYTVTKNGNYRVIVTSDKDCKDTSDIYIVTNVSGIKDPYSLANKIKVYPNPSTDIINIYTPINLQLQLSSMDGRLLIIEKDVKSISLRSLSAGVYFLSLRDKQGNLIKVEKIVKE